MIPHKIWGHHQPDVSDHPEHDGDAPDGVVAVPLLLLGHQDEPEVGQDVGAQYLSVVYLSLLVFLRSECRNTQLCGWCQLVWRNSGNCDLMGHTLFSTFMKPKSLVNICIKIVICYGSAAVNQFVVRLLQNFADVTRVNLIYPPYHHLYYLDSLISASAYHGGPEQEPAGRRG